MGGARRLCARAWHGAEVFGEVPQLERPHRRLASGPAASEAAAPGALVRGPASSCPSLRRLDRGTTLILLPGSSGDSPAAAACLQPIRGPRGQRAARRPGATPEGGQNRLRDLLPGAVT